MDKEAYSRQTTYITLISFAIGFIGYVFNYFFWILMAIVFIVPKYYHFSSHSWIKIGSMTATTFVFGIINGYSYFSIRDFYLSEDKSVVPTLAIYLSLVTVYHYFEFQMVNNFHYHELEWKSKLIIRVHDSENY